MKAFHLLPTKPIQKPKPAQTYISQHSLTFISSIAKTGVRSAFDEDYFYLQINIYLEQQDGAPGKT